MKVLSIDIICCCCTCIFSLVVAAYTFYKTKKLHFFNAYFEKKANAYNEFFDAISHFPFDEIQATPEFTAALHKITLYASDEALQHCLSLADELKNLNSTYQCNPRVLHDAITAFREDIDNCKKFHFR